MTGSRRTSLAAGGTTRMDLAANHELGLRIGCDARLRSFRSSPAPKMPQRIRRDTGFASMNRFAFAAGSAKGRMRRGQNEGPDKKRLLP